MQITFLISALILSLITTLHMVRHRGAGKFWAQKKIEKKELSEKEQANQRADLWQDYILNYVGCALGWAALYYLIFYRLNVGSEIGITDLVIIIFTYIGITGYLPHLIINKSYKPY